MVSATTKNKQKITFFSLFFVFEGFSVWTAPLRGDNYSQKARLNQRAFQPKVKIY